MALFVANCAQCHGEKGDGEGVTQLDRKARSFLDGGFSYGNTPDALFRSITHGIPGTPMPGFEKPLSEAQRRELAAYVIALGPADQIVVDPKDSEIVVRDRPVFVRGKLPSIAEGEPEWPRGLLVGLPEGLTFEYRADDVQLLAVRAGRFVNRQDWGGRGGDPLEPLGKVVWRARAAGPSSLLYVADTQLESAGKPLPCRLRVTQLDGATPWIAYDARLAGVERDAPRAAGVRESVRAFTCDAGTGFVREFEVEVEPGAPALEFVEQPIAGAFGLRSPRHEGGQIAMWGTPAFGSEPLPDWVAIAGPEGIPQVGGPRGVGFVIAPGTQARLRVCVLPGVRLAPDSDEERAVLRAAFPTP